MVFFEARSIKVLRSALSVYEATVNERVER
jgi:hypothetical protein